MTLVVPDAFVLLSAQGYSGFYHCMAVTSLINYKEAIELWYKDRKDFVTLIVTFVRHFIPGDSDRNYDRSHYFLLLRSFINLLALMWPY
jgi:hypothetical protein